MIFFTKKKLINLACALAIPFLGIAQPTATVTVGTGTNANYQVPLNTFYGFSYTQQLYLASEINKPLGGTITMIRFYWSGGTYGLSSSNTWTVYIGNTTKTSFAGSTDWVAPGTLSTIYTGTITAPTTNQWIDIPLSTPFNYTGGTNSIVVGLWENVSGYASSLSTFRTTATSNTRAISTYDDYTAQSPTAPTAANGIYSYYPNIQFEFVVPPNNAGINAIPNPPANTEFCSGPQEARATIHNFGSNILNNVNVNWSVNGVLQPVIAYNTPIDMENTTAGPEATITLGTVDFAYNTPTTIKAWTSMPNGVADAGPANDSNAVTITASLLGINDFRIAPQDTIICSGESITLDAGTHPKNPIYIWNNGSLEQTRVVSTPGTYYVKVQNSDGCVARDTIAVTVHPDPLINSVAIIDNADGSFTFNAIGAQNIFNYTWNFGDGSAEVNGTGLPGQVIHSFACGDYTVTLTLNNDCGTIVSTREVSIDCATGIDNISALQKEISIFPNPSKANVTIAHKAHVKMKEISIVNLMGQSVYKNDKVNAEQIDINTTGFAAGIYNVLINTEKGTITKKLEVIK
ncbi:MAG: T9SS type A sorting domain-containing protein [Sphingobacteriales bacterium]|nr:MAG: T9SS type A sorting domain-containing protein [Sphingobacteriales bacterium]